MWYRCSMLTANLVFAVKKSKSKAVPVTGHGGL
jgi:hypothetical protein